MKTPPRPPKYGDEIYLPSMHPDGHWCNGIVNSGFQGVAHVNNRLLIAAPGHAKSNLVTVSIDAYGEQWIYPEDIGERPHGSKRSTLREVQG